MSESIDAVGAVSPVVERAHQTASTDAVTNNVGTADAAAATAPDVTTEVVRPDGAVTVVVTDAKGDVISTTTIDPAAPVSANAPHPLISIEA